MMHNSNRLAIWSLFASAKYVAKRATAVRIASEPMVARMVASESLYHTILTKRLSSLHKRRTRQHHDSRSSPFDLTNAGTAAWVCWYRVALWRALAPFSPFQRLSRPTRTASDCQCRLVLTHYPETS